MTQLLLFTALAFAGGSFDRQIPLTNNRANELFQAEDYQGALDLYLKAYGEDRTNGALAYNIANAYMALGDTENAAKYYDKAMNSDHAQAKQMAEFNLGNLQMAQQNPAEALKRYVNYLKNNPNDVDAKRNLELALRQMQQQQQQPNQNQQDQDQQEQQQQEQQQQQQQQNGQEGQEDQQQQQESQQQQDSQEQNSQQNQQDTQNQEQQDAQNQEQQDNQNQQQESQAQDQEQKQENQADPKDSQEPQAGDQAMDEALKKQILEALDEQEQEQQKAHQQRKIGKVKRRSKDW